MRDSRRLLATVALTLVLTVGCQARQTEESESPGGETAAVEEAGGAGEVGGGAEGTPDARQAIAEINRRWEEAALAGDAAALASLYAEDAVLLPPGAPRVEGRAAIQSAFAEMFGAPLSSVSLESDPATFAESGELAYDVGRYTMAGTTPDGEAWQDTGKYLGVFGNVGGEWKLVADIWNSDAAPAM